MRIHRQNSGLEQTEMFQDSAKDGQYNEVSKARQLKGNQELNEELQMKADELEKLFAAHKLRVSGSQLVSSRRVSPVDVEEEDISLVQLPAGKEFERGLTGETVVLNPNKNLVELGRLNNSRGKFYDLYMQKRDAKLRGEWDSRRVQNEEKMMEMSERLECCRAEMNAYFAVSSDQRESTLQSRRRAEKLRSFDMCLVQKNNEQQAIETTQIQDGGVSDSSEQIRFRGDTPFSEIHLENGSSRSTQSKKFSQSRTFSSSIPRSSAPPIPRPSSKGSNFGSARRRVVPENPVGQSLPNFSDFKEESTKPSPGTHKEVTRSQNTHIPRSKSTNGHLPSAKKDNVWRSQSMKKSSVSPDKSKEFLPPKANGANMTPARKNGESKPFLKKGNGIGPGAGPGIAKLKVTIESETMNGEEVSSQMVDKREDSLGMLKEISGEGFKIKSTPTDVDSDDSRLSQESEKSGIPKSDGIVILKSSTPIKSDSVGEVATGRSTFHSSAGPMQDSPLQSHAPRSSNMRSPFSNMHRRLDTDVSMDSPMASPASWNSSSFSKLETSPPRTRKKWGLTQKPILLANASDQQSHSVTKGIKRLLMFGRKTRGTEGQVDCMSSTTSEGDDDTDDGRYLASRSSDDLRKSRMGISQGHCSYEAFKGEVGFISEEVQALYSSIPATPENYKLKSHHLSGSSLTAPRSFFSLSSFRSKGSDLKPR